jgi:polyisoprenoid-binding protein YceI
MDTVAKEHCMRTSLLVIVFGILVTLTGDAPARADDYALDEMHTAANFKISHLGLSWTYGRFDDLSGSFTIDADAGKSAFALTIKTDSIDTNNKKRDDHLRSPDFFNVKQFPAITFKSTSVKAAEGGYEVTGDLTLHGVTKSVTFPLKGGKTAEFPKGTVRTGYSTELVLKRSDYGMDKLAPAVGDEVYIAISFEGTKK